MEARISAREGALLCSRLHGRYTQSDSEGAARSDAACSLPPCGHLSVLQIRKCQKIIGTQRKIAYIYNYRTRLEREVKKLIGQNWEASMCRELQSVRE